MADIAIVIVSYNVRHFLASCLQSIRTAEAAGLQVETWVVDNASVDGSVALVRTQFPEVHLIANPDNVGFSAANNQALRQIRSRTILLLNPDTLLSEDTLRVCLDFMEKHQQAGAIGVRMIDGAGHFLPESKRQLPGLWNSFCKLFFLSDLFPASRWFSGYNLGYLPEDKPAKIDVLCGAFMFIRQEALAKAGLLDESFFMYGEDIDLSYRIGQAGYEIWYLPQTTIIHYKGESTKKSSLSYVRTFYGAMHTYVKKHYSAGQGRHLVTLINLAVTFRAGLSALRRVFTRWMSPLVDAVIIWFSLQAISTFWAAFYFNEPNYYKSGQHDLLLAGYTLVWVFFLWLGGQYAEKMRPVRRLVFMVAGLTAILLIYALLPEDLRSSRAIILLGALVSWLAVSVADWLRLMLTGSRQEASGERVVAIVGQRIHGEKLATILVQSGVKEENMYFIAPDGNSAGAWFANQLDELPRVVETLGINEVVYSSESMPLRSIMDSMTQLDARLVFRIGGDDALGIIGSPSKIRQGEWHGLEMRYQLAEGQVQRYKRLADICISIAVMSLAPLVYIVAGLRLSLFTNIVRVLAGTATWVGYGGMEEEYHFLPALPPAVIKVPVSERVVRITPGYARLANMSYAREYFMGRDFLIAWQNLYRLANKPG